MIAKAKLESFRLQENEQKKKESISRSIRKIFPFK